MKTPGGLIEAAMNLYVDWCNRDERVYDRGDLRIIKSSTVEGSELNTTVLTVSDGDQPADLIVLWEVGEEANVLRTILQAFDTMISLVHAAGSTYIQEGLGE